METRDFGGRNEAELRTKNIMGSAWGTIQLSLAHALFEVIHCMHRERVPLEHLRNTKTTTKKLKISSQNFGRQSWTKK